MAWIEQEMEYNNKRQSTKEFWVHNWKYFVIFIMLGVVMYWSALVVQPVIQILENQNEFMLNNSKELKANVAVVKTILNNLTEIDQKLDRLLVNETTISVENDSGVISGFASQKAVIINSTQMPP